MVSPGWLGLNSVDIWQPHLLGVQRAVEKRARSPAPTTSLQRTCGHPEPTTCTGPLPDALSRFRCPLISQHFSSTPGWKLHVGEKTHFTETKLFAGSNYCVGAIIWEHTRSTKQQSCMCYSFHYSMCLGVPQSNHFAK